MRLKIRDSHPTCNVANKCLNVLERVEVVEWNKRWSPPFPCCPVNRQCLWRKPWDRERQRDRERETTKKAATFSTFVNFYFESFYKNFFLVITTILKLWRHFEGWVLKKNQLKKTLTMKIRVIPPKGTTYHCVASGHKYNITNTWYELAQA